MSSLTTKKKKSVKISVNYAVRCIILTCLLQEMIYKMFMKSMKIYKGVPCDVNDHKLRVAVESICILAL